PSAACSEARVGRLGPPCAGSIVGDLATLLRRDLRLAGLCGRAGEAAAFSVQVRFRAYCGREFSRQSRDVPEAAISAPPRSSTRLWKLTAPSDGDNDRIARIIYFA